MELVSNLTSAAFIALRAGAVSHMYSDNGCNFVGANRMLKEAYELWSNVDIIRHIGSKSIQWHFNVPLAPHMVGYGKRL